MTEITQKNSTELMKNLFDTLVHHLKQLDFPEDEAVSISSDVTNAVMSNWGGQQIYIPFNIKMRLSKRDIAIFHEFNGHNQSHLAKKYNLSLMRIYRIIKNVRRDEMASRQASLFEEG